MKGVILAGGNGTRLHPLTKITNKHLLPLYNKPVIFHAVEKLVNAGIDRIMIVASPRYIEDFVNVLGSGQDFKPTHTSGKQIQIIYGIQNAPSGIADGLWIAKDFVGNDSVILHLGDNIIFDDIREHVLSFTKGARVFLKKVPDPHRFGVASLDKKGKVAKIIEKPAQPESDLAVAGIYMYDNTVFERMVGMPMSERGEYEITWVNNAYIKTGDLDAVYIKDEWFDIGTFDSLLAASLHLRDKKSKKV